MRLLLIFCLTFLVLICGDMFQVFSEAPTTPKILFTSTRDGNREVYMMNPDGSEQVNLTQHPATDLGAVWSPMGEQILFVSDRQGTRARDLYLMDADGSNVRRVFKKKTTDWRGNATWSPDGKQFAYESVDWDRLKFGLYLGTFGEEDAERLPYGASPAWSPDGSEIACSEVLTHWALDLHLSTSAHGNRNNHYRIKHSDGNLSRPGLLWVTNLPFLGSSIRCRSSWIGICTTHGRINRVSTSSTATAPVSGNLSMKRVPRRLILCYRQMARKCFIHKRLTDNSKSSRLM